MKNPNEERHYERSGREHLFENQFPKDLGPAPLLADCVTLGESCYFSETPFPHLYDVITVSTVSTCSH